MPAEHARLTIWLRDLDGNEVTVTAPDSLVPRCGPSGRPPGLKFGVAHNTLILELLLEGHAGTLSGLALALYAGEDLLAADAWAGVDVETSDPWTFGAEPDTAFSGAQALLLCCQETLVLDGSPQRTTFTISGLNSSQKAWAAASITVMAHNYPVAIAITGVDLTVRTTGLPAGPLNIAWQAPTTGEVIVTRDPARPVFNDLSISLSNGDDIGPLVRVEECRRDRPPMLYFHFLYADHKPGYGKLCTTHQIGLMRPDDVKLHLPEARANLGVTISAAGDDDQRYWSLPLREGDASLLEAGESAVVEFRNIVCDLPLDAVRTPDPTELIVRWQDIPGLADGEQALPLVKQDRVRIYDLRCQPPPGTPIDFYDRVSFTWHTRGANRSLLAGASPLLAHTGDGDDSPNLQEVFPCPGNEVFQVLAFEDEGTAMPAAAAQAVVISFKEPRLNYFVGGFVKENDALDLVLSWQAINADCCVLRSDHSEEKLPPEMQAHRIRQGSSPDFVGRYRLTAMRGKLAGSATLARYKVTIGERRAGGIVFAVAADGLSGWVVNEKDLGKMTWAEAFNACQALRDGGFADWRLPGVELCRLIGSNLVANSHPCFDQGRAQTAFYWSADADNSYGRRGYYRVAFLGRNHFDQALDGEMGYWVRAVRAFSADD